MKNNIEKSFPFNMNSLLEFLYKQEKCFCGGVRLHIWVQYSLFNLAHPNIHNNILSPYNRCWINEHPILKNQKALAGWKAKEVRESRFKSIERKLDCFLKETGFIPFIM